MPASDARSGVLLRAVTLALLAGALAGCSNSGRFEVNNPFDPPTPTASVKPTDVTGSVSKSSTSKVAAAPLPAPTKPATAAPVVTAQPATHSDVTGSVKTARATQAAGHWSWEGGTP